MENNDQYSAFGFEGDWKEFAPIAFTNLLLTIVTLGIYRFWATTRERKYLWSRTRFIDENLEWTGTGKELFLGALVVFGLMAVFGGTLIGLYFWLSSGGHEILALIPYFAFFFSAFYLGGIARFRMIRYRLGRTYWRGVRGGSDDQGFRYGWSHIWKMVVGYAAMGLMVPWATVSLWNERWNAMSFGDQLFRSDAEFSAIMWRFAMLYLVPILFMVGLIAVLLWMVASGTFDPEAMSSGDPEAARSFILTMSLALFAGYFTMPVLLIFYYAAFMRLVIGELTLGNIDFAFTARSWGWIKLFLGDVLLVICTLGIGFAFLGYRHWKFFIEHLEAYGTVDPDALSQSTTKRARHGEGLFEALDIGAI